MTMYVRALQPVTVSFSNNGAEYHLDQRAAYQVLPLWVAQLAGFDRLWSNHVVQVATDTAFSNVITSIPAGETGSGGGGGGSGTVQSVVGGTHISVNSADPANPVVSLQGLTTSDLTDMTATGRSLAQASTAPAARSTLGLGGLSVLSAVDADATIVTNLEVDNFKGTAIITATEGVSSSNNDTTIPTTAAVKAYADSIAGAGGSSSTATGGRYATAIGNGSATSIVVTHNLGTRDVLISVYDATTYEEVNCDKFHTSTNTVTLTFASAPASNALIAVVSVGGSASSITAHTDHFTLQDATDPTKQVVFSLAGLTTGTTRTLTVPDSNLTLGSGGSGGGDASTNTSTSVDSEVALFSGTGGKTLKRATGSGMAKLTSGVLSTGAAGTDYVAPGGALGTPSSGNLANCTFPVLNQNTTGTAAGITGKTTPSGALVGTTDTQNLGSKTLDNTNTVTLKDTGFTLQDNSDTTKQVVFELSGLTTGTTRTITIPDSSFTIPTTGGGGGGGDASTNTSTSVDGELALFSGTGGKTLKRATGSGVAIVTNGVLSTVAAIQPRVGTISSSATPTINLDLYDLVKLITLGTNVTSMSTNLSGTFYAGQRVMWKFKDDGTARTIAWGASFQSSGIATLLATTVPNKTHYMLTVYDADASKHVCIAVDPIGY